MLKSVSLTQKKKHIDSGVINEVLMLSAQVWNANL